MCGKICVLGMSYPTMYIKMTSGHPKYITTIYQIYQMQQMAKTLVVATYMFSGMTYSTICIKVTSGHPKADQRWLTKWLPKQLQNVTNDYRFGSSLDGIIKLIRKYRFSSIINIDRCNEQHQMSPNLALTIKMAIKFSTKTK